MNKLVKSLLVTALMVSGTSFAKDYRNKTFLMPRSHGVNLAMEHTAGWTDLIMKDRDDSFGGNVQVIPFYMSGDDCGLADYFTCSNKCDTSCNTPSTNTNSCDTSCETKCDTSGCKTLTFGVGTLDDATGKPVKADIEKYDLDANCFCHSGLAAGATGVTAGNPSEVAKLQLDVEHKAYGATFVYHQNLDKLCKSLYFRVLIPIVHVENDVKACWSGTSKDDLQKYFAGEKCVQTVVPADGGTTIDANTLVGQNKLEYLKFGDKCDDRSSTGVADIDMLIGYTFYENDCFWGSINFGLTIPTGDESNSRSLFEAVVGNGGHFAVGFGLDGGWNVWNDGDQSIKLHMALNYRYLFESSEKRTLGLADKCGQTTTTTNDCTPCPPCPTARCWGHYKLLGNCEKNALEPAANKLTQNVDVTPGSQIDMIAALWYNCGSFTFNVGYNLYWRDDEEIDRKNCEIFKKECWGFPRQDFFFNGPQGTDPVVADKFGNSHTDFECVAGTKTQVTVADNTRFITDADIVNSVAETPSQLSHKIYGGAAYAFNDWDVPFFVGFGAHYEFASDNSVVENWGVHGKVGMSF